MKRGAKATVEGAAMTVGAAVAGNPHAVSAAIATAGAAGYTIGSAVGYVGVKIIKAIRY